MKKSTIFLSYLLLILLLALIAYFASKKNVKVALLGALAGVVICTVLWFTVGKKNSEGYK